MLGDLFFPPELWVKLNIEYNLQRNKFASVFGIETVDFPEMSLVWYTGYKWRMWRLAGYWVEVVTVNFSIKALILQHLTLCLAQHNALSKYWGKWHLLSCTVRFIPCFNVARCPPEFCTYSTFVILFGVLCLLGWIFCLFDLVSFGKQLSPGDFPKLKKISKSYPSLFLGPCNLNGNYKPFSGNGDPLAHLLELMSLKFKPWLILVAVKCHLHTCLGQC